MPGSPFKMPINAQYRAARIASGEPLAHSVARALVEGTACRRQRVPLD
jgi:hypothetical protein